ncbi:hypothetical protein BGZ94_007757 [Podila epigama]|nr:hypothetical protein BGZ94_007757 [Podila epigama]
MAESIHQRRSTNDSLSNPELPAPTMRRQDRAPDSPVLSPIISEATVQELSHHPAAPPSAPFSHYLLPHQYLSFLFPITLLAGSAFGVVGGHTPSYFSNKRNILNMLFVKNGWGWTSLVFLVYIAIVFGKGLIQENQPQEERHIQQQQQQQQEQESNFDNFSLDQEISSSSTVRTRTRSSPSVSHDNNVSSSVPYPESNRGAVALPSNVIVKALVRWGLATLYWWLISQWFFGPALFDRVFVLTGGTCSVDGHWSQYHCRKNAGHWSGGIDISGHMFLLTHAWLFLMEELSVYMNVPQAWNNLQHRQGARYTVYAVMGLGALWWWMLLMTSVYYHHITEKISGLFFGLFFWFCSYVILYKKSSFPAMPDQSIPF